MKNLKIVTESLSLELESLKQNMADPAVDFNLTLTLLTLVIMDAQKLIDEVNKIETERKVA